MRRPVPGPATLAAYLLASLVYVLDFGLLAGGALLLVNIGTVGLTGAALGLVALLVGWAMRPRMPELDATVHGRTELPRLFALLDRAAAALGTAPPDGVVVEPEYNAAFAVVGWRRRRILFIGLPYWLVLDPQERVSLLGHELGHAVNGDARRGTFVGGAIGSLAALFEMLEPDELLPSEEGVWGYFQAPFRLVQLAIARFVLLVLFLLLLLGFRDGQRAEYYADALRVRLGGRRAALSELEKTHAAGSVARMTWVGETADPIGQIVAKVRTMPERERERIRRLERLEGSRLDATHPPTLYRIEVIEAQPDPSPLLVLSHGESTAIDAELERFREPMGRRLVDEHLSAVSW